MRLATLTAALLASTSLALGQGVAPKLLPPDGGTGSWAWVNVLNNNCVGAVCASAKGDGTTDDWKAIQLAMGMDSSGNCTYTQPTHVVIPPTTTNVYKISQAVRRCPWVWLDVQTNSTEILFTGLGTTDYTGGANLQTFPLTGAVLSGLVIAGSALPTLALSGALSFGAQSVTLATPAQASQLVVNDLVDVESTQTFDAGGAEPTQVKLALVSSINTNTGVIGLDRPMDFSSSSVQLRKLTNGANTAAWPTYASTNVKLFATHHSYVTGGRWIAGNPSQTWAQPFDGGGGCLDCVTRIDEFFGGQGIGYGNAYQDSYFSVRRENILTTPFEHSYGSNGDTIEIGDMYVLPSNNGRLGGVWDIGFNEGAHDNKLSVTRIIDTVGLSASMWLLGGTVSPSGTDALTLTVAAPAVTAATVNAAGSGYTATAIGTMTWSGSGCTTNPVLQVQTSAGGVISSVLSILTAGVCTTPPSSAATTWTMGGGLAGGSGASFTMTTQTSFTGSYTTQAGDTIPVSATNLAANLTAVSGFTSAGYTATANPPNSSGGILVTNSAGTTYQLTGTVSNSVKGNSPLRDIVKVTDASNNVVKIGSVTGSAINGYPVEFTGGTASGEPPTTDNNIQISTSTLAYQNGGVSISGLGSNRNTISGGWLHGPTFQPKVFWVQSPAGSFNTVSGLKSDAPGAYPWSDTNDITNAFIDLYAPLTPPSTATSFSDRQMPQYITMRRVASNAINKLFQLVGEFAQLPAVSSSGDVIAAVPLSAGPLEVGDAYVMRAHVSFSGSTATKRLVPAFWCTSVNVDFPADATWGDLETRCDFPGTTSTICKTSATSSSATPIATQETASSCSLGGSFNGSITFKATTGSDLIIPKSIGFSPYAPTYDSSIPRP